MQLATISTVALPSFLLLSRGEPSAVQTRLPPLRWWGRPLALSSQALVPDRLPGHCFLQDELDLVLLLSGDSPALLMREVAQPFIGELHPAQAFGHSYGRFIGPATAHQRRHDARTCGVTVWSWTPARQGWAGRKE